MAERADALCGAASAPGAVATGSEADEHAAAWNFRECCGSVRPGRRKHGSIPGIRGSVQIVAEFTCASWRRSARQGRRLSTERDEMSSHGGGHECRIPDDLCLLTSYFNPARFRKKRQRYLEFAARAAASGLPLFTVECAIGANDFEIPESNAVFRVRARDALWQKERLLNLAVTRLPSRYEKVVSVDFDLVFENPDWAVETSRLLDEVPLVQPFESVIWLPKGVTEDDGTGVVLEGFAARHVADSSVAHRGNFAAHGVPGYAWGARRSLLEELGHYDACVVGGGDHLMVHAACGDWTSDCFEWSVGIDSRHHRHFVRWAEAFHRDVRGRMACVPGRLLHLWHGEWKNRRYTSRHVALKAFDFDPDQDITIGPDGCWEWSSAKRELHDAVAAYFALRQEDGDDE